MPSETNGAEREVDKKVSIRVTEDEGNAYRAAALAYTAEGVKMGEVGARLIRHFIEATDAERRKMIRLPKPAKRSAAKA